jgi:two-component system sensor histidine kinase DctS
MLRDIAGEALRAGAIIRHLRDLIQKQETHQIPIDVPEIIETAIRLIHGDARRLNVDIQTRIARNLPQIRGDRIQLEQVLLNLLRNGIEAVVACGERRTITVTADHRSNWIELCVADQGKGLDPHVAANLFEPFLTTKSSGLGVGLYLCRSIVEAHNGRIWHQANRPQGAVFHISLPVLGSIN